MNIEQTTTVTFPNTTNGNALRAATFLALANKDFMGDTKKINKAVDALTPKDDLTRVFKQLQGNGLKDYLLEKEKGNVADTPEAKAAHIKKYITTKFEKHMINAETGPKATNMFNQEYPAKAEVIAAVAGLQSHFEPNPVVPAVGEQVDPVE